MTRGIEGRCIDNFHNTRLLGAIAHVHRHSGVFSHVRLVDHGDDGDAEVDSHAVEVDHEEEAHDCEYEAA